MEPFDALLLSQWVSFLHKAQHEETIITGGGLDIAAVTAIARYGATTSISPCVHAPVQLAADIIQDSLDKGIVVYGVNTGFGGSANTRTTKVLKLQQELIRMLNYGILPQSNISTKPCDPPAERTHITNGNVSAFCTALPLSSDSNLTLSESCVRASMLIRLNSLAKGASGVKLSTLNNLSQLLEHDIIPQVPLRGSISASGDLSPLSYIASAMMGKPSVLVYTGNRNHGRCLRPASEALAAANIEPVSLSAKEGLAIVNGTAISAGVGALATHEMVMQAGLAQILTAMSVEALKGTTESFDPFFANMRPHPGQREAAMNITEFLKNSQLLHSECADSGELKQDRYSIRTASQWLGPCLEDVCLAAQQVTIELNSVTDNPLIDTANSKILHGGNFQAKSITNAMEKLRQTCQAIGRLLFAQCTEIINPATNFGLPPNLVADDPSESFLWKGTDICVAALQAELGFLAGPVGVHVQTAEMGNQALNSGAGECTVYAGGA